MGYCMSFLTWDNEKSAEKALAIINANYNCPYTDDKGYCMKQWSFVTNSHETLWGFYKPPEKFMDGVDLEYTEQEKRPDDWYINEVD